MIEEQRTPSLSLLLSKMNRYKTNSMYQNLFSLDYIVNDEKKSVLMSVLNEDFIRMNRERNISSLRAFLSQIDDDAIDEKKILGCFSKKKTSRILQLSFFFQQKRTRQSREPIPFSLPLCAVLK
tara:strand:- start:149 stop:520 length:372 start_codon:yes stop_codon:yes gene_type:complete